MNLVVVAFRTAELSSGWGRTRVVFAITSAMALAFVLSTIVGLPLAIERQHERDLSRTLLNGSGIALSGLRADTREISIAGRSISLLLISGADERINIPGLANLPEQGEIFVSPRLQSVMGHDSRFLALVRSQEVAGMIGGAGLKSPAELRMIVGVSPKTEGLEPVAKVGAPELRDDPRPVAFATAALVSALLLLGAGTMVWLAGQTAGQVRQRRSAILGLLGVPRLQRRLLSALEAGVPAGVGAGLGVGVFLMASRRDLSVPQTNLAAYAEDFSPAFIVLVAIWVVTTTTSVLVALSQGSPRQASVRPALVPIGRRKGAIAALGTGLTALNVLPPAVAGISSQWALGSVLALTVLATAGMLAGTPALLQWLGSTVAHRADSPIRLLAGRGIEVQPSGALRVGLGVAVAIAMLGVSVPTIGLLNGGSELGESRMARGVTVLVDARGGAPGPLDRRELDLVAAKDLAVPVLEAYGRDGVVLNLLVATCSDLRELAPFATGCSGRPQWMSSNAIPIPEQLGVAESSLTGTVDVGGKRIQLPRLAGAVDAAAPSLEAGLLVPPNLFAPIGASDRWAVVVTGAREVDDLVLGIAGIDPLAEVDTGYLSWSRARFVSELQAIGIALAVGITIGFGCLALGSVADGRDRRDRERRLRQLGIPAKDVRRASLAGLLVPMQTVIAIAAALAVSAGTALGNLDERAELPAEFWLLLWALPAVGACAALGAAYKLDKFVPRQNNPTGGRHE